MSHSSPQRPTVPGMPWLPWWARSQSASKRTPRASQPEPDQYERANQEYPSTVAAGGSISSRARTDNASFGIPQAEPRVARPQRAASISLLPSRFHSGNTSSKPDSPGRGREYPTIDPGAIALQQRIEELTQNLEAAQAKNERAALELEREKRLSSDRDKQVRELSATLQAEQRKGASIQSAIATRERELGKELEQTKQRLVSVETLARTRQTDLLDAQRSIEDQRQKLAQQQTASVARQEALTNELLSTRKQLATAASDLALLRAVSGDDGDAQGLVTMFDDITDQIGEVAFRLGRKVRAGCRNAPITPNQLEVLHQSGENIYGFVRQYLEHCAQQAIPAPDTLNSITEAVISWLLASTIFDPFMPVGSIEEQRFSSELLKLQEDIRSVEPQEYSARWRAVTYKAMTRGRDDAVHARNVVCWVVDHLIATFYAFVDQSIASRAIQELEPDLTDIVTKALRWQDRARTRHYSYDYVGFLPHENSSFIEADMEMDSEVDAAPQPIAQVMNAAIDMQAWLAQDQHDREADAQEMQAVLRLAVQNDAAIMRTMQLNQDQIIDAMQALHKRLDGFTRGSVEHQFAESGLATLQRISGSSPGKEPDWVISPFDLEWDETPMDSGGFGMVHRGLWRRTEVAIKFLPSETRQKALLNEVNIWSKLSHPNIHRFLGLWL
ncbi:hypothetical protein AURDEDRAFT_171797 [Auricularia subglabra TFB-10046 SS5]|nr:hypothetical protein AURDEDRAFT_171797 [Auricularia subglabra TFB-10046 SS5]